MKNWIKKHHRIITIVTLLILCFAFCSCSESCARACKDIQSDYNGGLARTVKVYDIDGELIAEYSGKFDIETDHSTYILWDDEMGKRHIVYFTTATIIIDEE